MRYVLLQPFEDHPVGAVLDEGDYPSGFLERHETLPLDLVVRKGLEKIAEESRKKRGGHAGRVKSQ